MHDCCRFCVSRRAGDGRTIYTEFAYSHTVYMGLAHAHPNYVHVKLMTCNKIFVNVSVSFDFRRFYANLTVYTLYWFVFCIPLK